LLNLTTFCFRYKGLSCSCCKWRKHVPSLYNEDIVVFTGRANHPIANGTVIVFVRSSTNLNGLEILMRPVVIHRVVSTVTQVDGTVYYKTKEDNNQFPDPILVR
jgi:hypothetical protein